MKIRKLLNSFVLILIANSSFSQSLKESFQNPGKEARPRVWWHWMNGNVTINGIQKDLDWMEKSGIAGFQNFDANLMTPVIVDKKLVYMTPEWKEAFLFTTQLANKKGMEMTIAGSPGWSVTGGPWVEPQDGMKKYVWSETFIKGGKKLSISLNPLPNETGIMQNIPVDGSDLTGGNKSTKQYGQRIAVLAIPNNEISFGKNQPKISSTSGNFSFTQLTNGNLTDYINLEPGEIGEETYIQYEFKSPIEIQAITFSNGSYGELAQFNGAPDNRKILYSQDGKEFKEIMKVPNHITGQVTLSFEPIQARFFRLSYTTLAPQPGLAALFGFGGSGKPESTKVSEFKLFTSPRINEFEAKAGFIPFKEKQNLSLKENISGIQKILVLDLTDKVDQNGKLVWDAPKGNWTIIQMGYSLTGRENHPASPEATGLEVDKLNKEAVSRYLRNYLDQYKNATGGLMGAEGGLTHMVLDSYEAGHMNWTQNLEEEFKARRGYELRPFMPVLAGYIIQDSHSSERFLWDFRKTIGELIVENHYETIGSILKEYGMKRYTESHENGRIYLADGMDVKRMADIPMAAMWQPGGLDPGTDEAIRSQVDIRESASVAHIYGQNITAAESMTSIMKFFSPHPGSLKRTADMEMYSGVNRFVIHTSVHQPLDDKMPGFSLGPFGQYFSRQETWANQARVWIDYLARSSYMLQKGKNVADILVYYGENTNLTSEYAQELPPVPFGYEWDFVNSSALKNALDFQGNEFVSKGGTYYKVLFLDKTSKEMSLGTLKRILSLANLGGKIIGYSPEYSPSFSDDQKEYENILHQLKNHKNVDFSMNILDFLKSEQINPDIQVKGKIESIRYKHRREFGRDIYWILNHDENENSVEILFNIKGKKPVLFNPETGQTSEINYEINPNHGTFINLKLSPWDAKFIVFEETTFEEKRNIPELEKKSEIIVEGPWMVNFQKNRMAPESIQMDQLKSLDEHSDPNIKYFSGEATYSKEIEINQIGRPTILDLGDVRNLVEVWINDQYVQTLWKSPFKVDIGDFIHKGKNKMELKVVNSWVNRLVGDQQPNAQVSTFITMPLFRKESPTEKSGLLGPVKLELY